MLGHAECAARVPAILSALETHALADTIIPLQEWNLACIEDILPVHNKKYLIALERASDVARDVAHIIVESAPTYVTQTTYRDTLQSAGAVMALVDHVVASSSPNNSTSTTGSTIGFALCRPPGHHAVPTNGMGFCLLNNAAIAARHAQRAHNLKKIAIFDWDVHHGNGTQDVFFNDPSVLFISTHQQGSYPNTGKVGEVGGEGAEGTTINIPLPGDAGHLAALHAFDSIVGPAIQRFEPDIILVSAGYDAHWKDPLAGLQFRSTTYFELAQRVKEVAHQVCEGRVVFLLEGGYDLDALGESVASSVSGLVGGEAIDSIDASLLREEPNEKVQSILRECRSLHSLL